MALRHPSANSRVVKPFYHPPTLVAKQALTAFCFGLLTRWERLPRWLSKARKTLPTAAGAVGMGCIGFPTHPVWEVTTRCNLRCQHCHASAGKPLEGELTTAEGKALLRDLTSIGEFRLLVLSGGEPLVRPDIWELIEYASSLGLEIAIATNATLITPEVARCLKKAGVCDLAIGLDGATAEVHDFIRGIPGCFERTMRGIYATKEADIALQINITVMKHNYPEIPQLLDLADELEAEIVLLYQLVPAGRGERDGWELSPEEYAALLELVRQRQRRAKPIIEPTCSPQYWAYLLQRKGKERWRKLAAGFFKGCVAGSGLCYIKPDGEVWACPFIPLSAGNVRHTPLSRLWREASLFHTLRHRENLRGKCRTCLYRDLCGGCRGRAYAHYGDYLADDPLCFLPAPTSRT